MSLISVFPDPPAYGEVTLCEYNTKYVSEGFEKADLKKHVPATHVSLRGVYAFSFFQANYTSLIYSYIYLYSVCRLRYALNE
jgi:hypothetical protein